MKIVQKILLEHLKHKFSFVPQEIELGIRSVENETLLERLSREILAAENINEFNRALLRLKIPSGKSGLAFRQNYDAVVKWMGEQFKGRTLGIFGVKTEPIVETFNFEPVAIRIDTGRVDLMLRDESGNLYHLEEQRDMTARDLHRFGIYHFQAAKKWMKTRITDVILASGKPYNGDKTIQTGNGTYSPVIIDLSLKDGKKRLKEIKEEVDAGNYDNLIELVFLPLYGADKKGEKSKQALEVLNYEVKLFRESRFPDKLVIATNDNGKQDR